MTNTPTNSNSGFNNFFLKPTSILVVLAVVIIAGIGIYALTNNKEQKSLDTANTQSSSSQTDSNLMNMDFNMGDMVLNDQSFLENMLPHHKEAVDSSNIILKSTQNEQIKAFANKVITNQTAEIQQMNAWYQEWYKADYPLDSGYSLMMTGMEGKSGVDLDAAYINGMISHHKGAVQMSEKILNLKDIKSEITDFSKQIITNQSAEIKELETLSPAIITSSSQMDMISSEMIMDK